MNSYSVNARTSLGGRLMPEPGSGHLASFLRLPKTKVTFAETLAETITTSRSCSSSDVELQGFCRLSQRCVEGQHRPTTSDAIHTQVRQLMLSFQELSTSGQKKAMAFIATSLAVDPQKIKTNAAKISHKNVVPGSPSFARIEEELRNSLSPPYYWLFANMGNLDGGVKFLVDLRGLTTDMTKGDDPDVTLTPEDITMVKSMNHHLRSLLSLWFSVGMLTLEQVTWDSPCAMLQKISDYEAVHPLKNWTDLKSRVGPYRRCFVYTHRSMPGEPIVVLHVALTTEIPSSISSVVKHHRRIKRFQTVDAADGGALHSGTEEDASHCTAAIFYSISSTQRGLTGIELGNILIKQAVKKLNEEFPQIKLFSTLSPIPGFKSWLLAEIMAAKREQWLLFKQDEVDELKDHLPPGPDFYEALHPMIRKNLWAGDEKLAKLLESPLMRLCAKYLYLEKRRSYALNNVANFHLRNGAMMWRINWMADLSPRGLDGSCGIMVNYRYSLGEEVAKNSTSYQLSYEISAGEQVLHLAKSNSC